MNKKIFTKHFVISRKNKVFALIFLTTIVLFSSWYAVPKILLFEDKYVNWNFGHMDLIFPSKTIVKGNASNSLLRQYQSLPESYRFMDRILNLDTFLNETKSNGLLIIKDNKVIFETYLNGYGQNSRFTSFSVAKSIIATAVGIALSEGKIHSTEDKLEYYVESLKGSPMGQSTIQEILNMSSGVQFTEKYDDESTDAFTIFNDMFIKMRSIDTLAKSYDRVTQQENRFHYASINTHYLKMLLENVYDKSLSEILADQILTAEKMSNRVSILTDMHRQEIGFWGINATLEDLGKFGTFVLNEVKNPHLLSEKWTYSILHPSHEYLEPPHIDGHWGYSNHWWLAQGEEPDFSAIGIWGQFVYIHPEQNVVIVKVSADRNFKEHEYETIQVFRQMVDYISD